MPLTKALEADYGAAGDGIADDADNLRTFRTDGQAASGLVTLNLEAGTFLIDSPDGAGETATAFAAGIPQFLCAGASQSTSIIKKGSAGFPLVTGIGMAEGQTGVPGYVNFLSTEHSARIATVLKGSDTLQLLTLSDHTRFTVGSKIILASLDLQGSGDPANPYFFEYPRITAIDTGTGIITITPPARNTHKSTWPLYNDGSSNHGFNSDCGGPATIYALDPRWDAEVEYRDLTLDQDAQIKPEGRDVTLRRVTVVNPLGVIMSQVETIRYIDCDCSNNIIEVDKIAYSVLIDNTPFNTLSLQSSDNELIIQNGSAIQILDGTARYTTITDSTVGTLKIGSYAYGRCETLSLSETTVSSFQIGGVTVKGTLAAGDIGVQNTFTMSAGLITVPIGTGYIPSWAVPGTLCFWWDDSRTSGSFTILDVWRDASNTYVQTTWPGGFPTNTDFMESGKLYIKVHPCPSLTSTYASINSNPFPYHPDGAPFASYWKTASPLTKSTVGNSGAPTFTGTLWGMLVSLKVNVLVAHTGSALTFHAPAYGDNFPAVLMADGSTQIFATSIDLTQTGERVITPTSVTAAKSNIGGISGGDTLSAPGNIWIGGGSGMGASSDISGGSSPLQMTVEFVLDQGFLPQSTVTVARPRFRWH